MKKAIISLATDRGNYYKGICRLAESLRGMFDGEFLGFMGEASIGAPYHTDTPYGFKVTAFKHARKMGFDQVLWLDSSVYAINDVQPVFDMIDRQGFIGQDSGHVVGQWTNDHTLNHFSMSRDEAMGVKMIGNAGMLGLNLNAHIADSFLAAWYDSMLAGCFNGAWNNARKTESNDRRCSGHRHDMSCSSIIWHRMGLPMVPGDQILQYAGPSDPVNNNTIIFKAQGL